jgi:hypothetical protein
MMRAVFLRELGFVFRAGRSDHVGAEMVRPLTGNEADAAGGSMDEHVVALLHAIGSPQEIFHGHALEHHAGGLLVADLVRQLHRSLRRQQPLGGI